MYNHVDNKGGGGVAQMCFFVVNKGGRGQKYQKKIFLRGLNRTLNIILYFKIKSLKHLNYFVLVSNQNQELNLVIFFFQ